MEICQIGLGVACDKMDREVLKRCSYCEHYKEEKMDFFEARKKAKDGAKLCHDSPNDDDEPSYIIVRKEHAGEHGMYWEDGNVVAQWCLFEKEWTIIPQKKTVTIEIPEGAENVKLVFRDDDIIPLDSRYGKVTYEIEEN